MADALSGLRDIHLPPAITWWPVAPGVMGIASLFVLLFVLAFFRYRFRRSRQIKQEALRQLARYQQEYEQTACIQTAATHLSALLKQVALLYYPRVHVAALQGDAWLLFLTQTSKKLNFESVRCVLLESPFHRETKHAVDPLFLLTKAWIKQRGRRCLS